MQSFGHKTCTDLEQHRGVDGRILNWIFKHYAQNKKQWPLLANMLMKVRGA